MSQTAPELEPPPVDDPLVGRTLDGRYVVEGVLGAGGMGLVYKARHAVLGKQLAIKVLKSEVSRDEQVMARFRREAQSASAIGSQHICDVSDFGSLPDGSKYFVMEFLDGPSLGAVLKRERPLPPERLVRVGQQLCDALGAAHERGIIHRDLKPDNVHLVRQGPRTDFVKVLDFGIAKVGGAVDKKLTQAGQIFGTPHYMSPEQCAGREVDHRTDLYAVGVMLYEMATGKVPFDADNLMGVLTKHVYEQPIPPRELPAPVDVPPGLEAIILKCLAKQPEQRYQTMFELRADLDRLAQGATPEAVVSSLQASTPGAPTTAGHVSAIGVGAPPPEERKSRLGLVLLGIVMIVGLGAGAFGVAFFLAFGEATGTTTEAVATPPPAPEPPEPPPPPPPVAAPEPTPAPVAAPPVRLVTDPAGAEVYSGDGSLIGNSPLDVPRPEGDGSVELTLRMPGYEDRSFVVSRMTAQEVVVRLSRASSGRPRSDPRPAVPTPLPTPTPLAPAPRPSRPSVNNEIIDPF